MGEYFKGHKLGTCEHLMYITREELVKFCGREGLSGKGEALERYLSLSGHFIYRFPREKDQAIMLRQIDAREPFDYLRVYVPRDFELLHRDFAQVTMSTAEGGKVVVNMPFCPLSQKAAEAGLRPINYWPEVQIIGNRYDEEHPDGYTIFACPFCGSWFSCDEAECDVIRDELTARGYAWEAEYIKAYT